MPPVPLERSPSLERFARMGLSGNPFRVVEESELANLYVAPSRVEGTSAREIARSDRPLTQIIAARGWGKSTLLYAIRKELEALCVECHFTYCLPGKPVGWQVPGEDTAAVLIDEAQRLSQRSRQNLKRWREQAGGRIVAGTHEDLSEDLGPGMLSVQLPAADAELIARMFRARVRWAGDGADPFPLAPDAAGWLAERAAGSLRWVEEFCYELFQELEPREDATIDVDLLQRIDR